MKKYYLYSDILNKLFSFELANNHFLIADNGNYFSFYDCLKSTSTYHGFYLYCNFEMYKILDFINLPNEQIQKIFYYNNEIFLFTKNKISNTKSKINIQITNNKLLVHSNNKIDFELYLDPRKIYDFDDFDRIFDDLKNEYCKINPKTKQLEYKIKIDLSVFSPDDFKSDNSWVKQVYPYDEIREHSQKNRYILKKWCFQSQGFELIAVIDDCNKFILKNNTSLISNIKKTSHITKNITNNIFEKIQTNELFSNLSTFQKEELILSIEYALRAFFQLHTNVDCNNLDYMIHNDIVSETKTKNTVLEDTIELPFAGYFWFFQYWTRDIAISLNPEKNISFDNFKKIILFFLKQFSKENFLINRIPHSTLESIDGLLWILKRYFDNYELFSKEEKKYNIPIIKKIYEIYLNKYYVNNLIENPPKTTWMDTINRDGASIEINALFFNLLEQIEKNNLFQTRFIEFKNQILNSFLCCVDEKIIILDNIKEKKIRPNLFLAYYINSNLFEKEVWENSFDYYLKHLLIDFDNDNQVLSTLNKCDSCFVPLYSGMNDLSYHNGDSWYFINNLCANSLYHLNSIKYKKTILKLINSSKDDILKKGLIGSISEVTSATKKDANGALSQLWSVASYLEFFLNL